MAIARIRHSDTDDAVWGNIAEGAEVILTDTATVAWTFNPLTHTITAAAVGGAGGIGNLAETYAIGAVEADQTMAIKNTKGGQVIFDGTTAALTGSMVWTAKVKGQAADSGTTQMPAASIEANTYASESGDTGFGSYVLWRASNDGPTMTDQGRLGFAWQVAADQTSYATIGAYQLGVLGLDRIYVGGMHFPSNASVPDPAAGYGAIRYVAGGTKRWQLYDETALAWWSLVPSVTGSGAADRVAYWDSASTITYADAFRYITASGFLGVGRAVDPSGPFHVSYNAASTGDVFDMIYVDRLTTAGGGADGDGAGLLFRLSDDLGATVNATRIAGSWLDSAAGSEDSTIDFYTRAGGAALARSLRLYGGGGAGATPYLELGQIGSAGAGAIMYFGSSVYATNGYIWFSNVGDWEVGYGGTGNRIRFGQSATASFETGYYYGSKFGALDGYSSIAGEHLLTLTDANHGAFPASTERHVLKVVGNSITWAAGSLTTQRAAALFAPTYTISGGASTITDAATLYAEAPIAGTTTTLTNRHAAWFYDNSTATNAATDLLRLETRSTGTAASGLGSSIVFMSEDASDNPEIQARMRVRWTTATGGSEHSLYETFLRYGGSDVLALPTLRMGPIESTWTQAATTSSNPLGWTFAVGQHSGLSASTELTNFVVEQTPTATWATGGTVSLQRFIRIVQPNTATAGTTIITEATTVAIEGAPNGASGVEIDAVSALRVGGDVSLQAATTEGGGYPIYSAIRVPAHTLTLVGTPTFTNPQIGVGVSIGRVTITDASAATLDSAASLYINNAPLAAGSVTLTYPWSIFVDAGACRFDGTVQLGAISGGGGVTGALAFAHASSTYLTTFQAGNATAAATYTLPTAAPAANGQALVATTGGAMSWAPIAQMYVAKLDSNHTISSATATEVTGLQVSLTAGTYVFKYWLLVTTSATATGLKFGVNYTGTASPFQATMRFIGTGTTAVTDTPDNVNAAGSNGLLEGGTVQTESTTAANLGFSNMAATSSNTLIILEGIMVVSDAGDLELWHSSDASAAQTDVVAGSSVVVTRIA